MKRDSAILLLLCTLTCAKETPNLPNAPTDAATRTASSPTILDSERVAATPNFRMGPNLICTVFDSTDPSEKGTRITLVGIDEPMFKAVFESRIAEEFKIVHNDEFTFSAVSVSGTGGVDVLAIDKKTGKFSRAGVGNMVGVFAHGAIGSCR